MTSTDLRFLGDWTLWAAVPVALAVAGVAWWLYWRETRNRKDALRWMLPTLRAAAIVWLLLILTGPVLHHRKIVGEVARILLFVDASASMTATDDQMDPARKVMIAQQLGWLHGDKIDPALRQAAGLIAAANAHAASVRLEMTPEELRGLVQAFLRDAEAAGGALGSLRAGSWPGGNAPIDRFRRELVLPATELSRFEVERNPQRVVADLVKLARAASDWDNEIGRAMTAQVKRLIDSGDSAVQSALNKFDATPRWLRAEGLLLEGRANMLGELASRHRVELVSLEGARAELVWTPRAGDALGAIDLPGSFRSLPTNQVTDLATGVTELAEKVREGDRAAVVILSDGQHNSGPSPEQMAKVLGKRGLPVFTVALGSAARPPDLAILEVNAPDTVFHEAGVKGDILLKDDVPVGRPFTLRIQHEGRTLWERALGTEQNPRRAVAFDFPIKDLVKTELGRKDKDLKFGMLPLSLTVSATAVEGERNTTNNTARLLFSAITEKPKVLMLEGRPRWEFRYVRNLFERDQRWEINALLAGAGGEERPWGRGKLPGQFPPDRESLLAYQLIVFGDLPLNMLRREELAWIKDFIERRGGGIIFIDGRQAQLVNYANTELGPLLPVEWKEAPLAGTGVRLRLAASRSARAPLSLVPDDARNAELWSALPAPRWVSPAQALPGTETLVEAALRNRTVSAMVFRRYGAGRVLYCGFDESWRWRYDVGDLYHQKFWNQIAKWIMEPPYPVEDKYVALDTGPAVYAPGDTAEIRARLRDAQGRLMLRAKADALLFRNGQRAAVVALEPDHNIGGTFRGRTPALEPGDYEVRVQVDGLPADEMKARTEFHVAARGAPELAQLHANEELLRQMASHSGGEFYREEEATRLLQRLEPLSEGKIVETETVLWQSWWWFAPLVLLLTLEWALRKRAGML